MTSEQFLETKQGKELLKQVAITYLLYSSAIMHTEMATDIVKEIGGFKHEFKQKYNRLEHCFDDMDKEFRKMIESQTNTEAFAKDYEILERIIDKASDAIERFVGSYGK